MGHRSEVLAGGDVTVIGSGQSAAEIVADLLAAATGPDGAPLRLRWFTRSRGFLPMEYSKLGLEHFSPEYTRWFHSLPEEKRDELRSGQDLLYKGISADTSALIYDLLYEATIDDGARHEGPGVRTASGLDMAYTSGCELWNLEPRAEGVRLHLHHRDDGTKVEHTSRHVILATGYRPAPLPLTGELAKLVERDNRGRPVIGLDHRVHLPGRPGAQLYAQNAELHTHGVGAPDLGLGAWRSAGLVNSLVGRDVYPTPGHTVFQAFGTPSAPTSEAPA
jgi:lysine N6-hydroxylase